MLSMIILIHWRDFTRNEKTFLRLDDFKIMIGDRRLIVLFNRFLGSSCGSILFKRPPLIVHADVPCPFSDGLKRLPLIRQYGSQIFKSCQWK